MPAAMRAIAALCDRLGNHLPHLASRSAQKDGYHKKLPFFCCRIGKNFLFILRLHQLVAAQQLFQMLTRLRLHLIQRQAAAAAAVSHQVHCLFDRNRIDVREQRVDQLQQFQLQLTALFDLAVKEQLQMSWV